MRSVNKKGDNKLCLKDSLKQWAARLIALDFVVFCYFF